MVREEERRQAGCGQGGKKGGMEGGKGGKDGAGAASGQGLLGRITLSFMSGTMKKRETERKNFFSLSLSYFHLHYTM